MSRGLMFVSIAALAGGTWSVLVSRASRDMSPVLGPIIAETTGVIIALVLLSARWRETTLEYSTRGITLLLFAGVCVFSVDYFSLRAYGTHLPVSVGAPVFMGGVILVATFIGFMLGDAFTLKKLVGISLIVAGAAILAGLSQ
jgi:transporter family protein